MQDRPFFFTIIALITTSLLTSHIMAAEIMLASDGKSDYSIFTADDAPAPLMHAAKELQEHLKLSTGAELSVRKLSDATNDETRVILVGPSDRARELLGSAVDWSSLEHDGIVMKTSGDTLILAGGEPRGTIYAVNTFLEDVVGVRWWTSKDRDIPKKPMLTIDPKLVDRVYVPKLRYREAFYNDFGSNSIHSTRRKINGHHNQIPPELGGHYEILGWCHTFYQLLPPDKYFTDHPEWYSQIEGKRSTEHAQLCLTNEEVRKELVQQALKWIREKPTAGIISVAQNDSGGARQCADCQAIVAEEGSESGPLVRFVNAVAADINQEYPDFLVETLAYQYTRKPPARTRPSENVLIRLCSIEADFSHPLSAPANKAFADDLRGWSKIAPKLFIWNYITNFPNYLIPHPNMASLGADLRLFVEHNAVGVFEQGDFYNPSGAGDFLPLRAWMVSKLLWDPSLDQEALRDEFMNGYYGPAGKPLSQYLDLIARAAADSGKKFGCYHEEISYVSPAQWTLASELFDKAEQAVANDPEKLARVKRERLVLDHVALLRYDFDKHGNQSCAKYEAAVDEFVQKARTQGVQSKAEWMKFEAYEPVRAALRGTLQAERGSQLM